MAMNYKKMTIQDIIAWCKANNQVEWLKATAAKKTACKVYPRIMKDGKSVADKSQEPKIEYRPITFVELKVKFVETFMPEIMPKKQDKKLSMHDLIASL